MKIGDYQTLCRLSQKTFAETYSAENSSGQRVFLKRYLHLRPGTTEGRKFHRAQLALKHRLLQVPEAATLFDFLEIDTHYVGISEWIDGRALADLNDTISGRAERLLLARRLVKGVARLHSVDIVHNDLKPMNILLGKRLAIVDFDGASVARFGGYPMGTLWYASPEHYSQDGLRTSGAAADIFSTALIVYELLTGFYAFVAEDVTDSDGDFCKTRFTAAVDAGLIPTFDEDGLQYPASLEACLRRATALIPADRPTAEELSNELERAV